MRFKTIVEANIGVPDFQVLQTEIEAYWKKVPTTLVVLDDDPTGTQTVYGVPVVTEWSESVLAKEIAKSPIFFVLTNSRSLQAEEANRLALVIGERLYRLTTEQGRRLIVISRGDSTLRGHYPNEVNALAKGLGREDAVHIIAPAFFEGGRYTYDNMHYVREADTLVPAAETPFAQDSTFGYKSSRLTDWILEKYAGCLPLAGIKHLSVSQIRTAETSDIQLVLEDARTTHLALDAINYYDLQKVALALLSVDSSFVLRTAASFVNAISGIAPKDCISGATVLGNEVSSNGALIVVGSYVSKTTLQLNHLRENTNACFIELNASLVLEFESFEQHLDVVHQKITNALKKGQDTVLFTSRAVVEGSTKEESLRLVNKVSHAVIEVVKKLTIAPKYILAKGGITSSDVATKGLNVKRARVLGQLLKGVPVWQLGSESKFPKVAYIVFPGNVGEEDSLTKITRLL